MQDVIKMLESQGYREGGVLRFEGGGRPTDNTDTKFKSEPNALQLREEGKAEEEAFVEPAWVSKAHETIGTGVEPVYKTVKGGHDQRSDIPYGAPIGYRYDNGKSEYQYLDLNGNPTSTQHRGGVLEGAFNLAKDMSPIALAILSGGVLGPELTPWLQGARGLDSLSHGDVLGGLASMAGAGGYSDAAQALRAGKAIQSGDPLAILGSAANISGNEDLQEISKGAKALSGISKGNIGSILGAAGDYSGNQDIKDILPWIQTATKAANASKNPQAAIAAILASGSQKPVDLASLFPKGITADTNPS